MVWISILTPDSESTNRIGHKNKKKINKFEQGVFKLKFPKVGIKNTIF